MTELWKKSITTNRQLIIEKYDNQRRIVEKQVYVDKNNDGYYCDTELVSHTIFGYRENGKRIEQERQDTNDDGYFDINILRKSEMEDKKYMVVDENINKRFDDMLGFHIGTLNSEDSSLKTKKQAQKEIAEFDKRVAANLSDDEIMERSLKVAKIEFSIDD